MRTSGSITNMGGYTNHTSNGSSSGGGINYSGGNNSPFAMMYQNSYNNNNNSNKTTPTTPPIVNSNAALNAARQTIMGRLAAATSAAGIPRNQNQNIVHANSFSNAQAANARQTLAPKSLRQLHHMSMPPFVAPAVTAAAALASDCNHMNAATNATTTTNNNNPFNNNNNNTATSLINHFNNAFMNSAPKPFYNASPTSVLLKCKFSCRSFYVLFPIVRSFKNIF